MESVLDAAAPTAVGFATVGGALGLVALWLAGALLLLRMAKVRLVLQGALVLSVTLALVGLGPVGLSVGAVTLSVAALAPVLGAWTLVRRRLSSPSARSAAGAAVVLALDALYLSPGGLAMMALLGAVVLAVAAALGRAVVGPAARARAHAGASLVWLAAALAMAGFSRLNLHLSRERSAKVVAACLAFERDRGRLPASLEELVPAHLERVPRVDWTLGGAFRYDAERGTLSYFAPWPSERVYDFPARRWATAEDPPSAAEEQDVGPGDDPGQGLQAFDVDRIEVPLPLAGEEEERAPLEQHAREDDAHGGAHRAHAVRAHASPALEDDAVARGGHTPQVLQVSLGHFVGEQALERVVGHEPSVHQEVVLHGERGGGEAAGVGPLREHRHAQHVGPRGRRGGIVRAQVGVGVDGRHRHLQGVLLGLGERGLGG
jgi:hypothetical protein